MGYLGNSNVVQNFTPAVDYFNGNGSSTAFTLSRTVGSVFDVQAFIENVPQNPSTAFTVAGNVITFTSAPPSGTNNIYVRYTSPVTQLVKPAPGTVGPTELAGGPAAVSDQLNSSTGYFDLPTGTTAERPGTPANGMIRMNTTTGSPEWYSAAISAWIQFNQTPTYGIDYLIVAGGSGGGTGTYCGGGGGGGEVLTASSYSLNLGQAYTITIGAGGAAVSSSGLNPGSNSVFNSISARGGGTNSAVANDNSGAGSGNGNARGAFKGGSGSDERGGGGGGAGGVGASGSTTANGGAGVSSAYSGSSVGYGGGGGGGQAQGYGNSTALGQDGGGNGSFGSSGAATSGTANRGGGGGGGASVNVITSGAGGSGVVIIRYIGAQRGTGGTVTASGGYTIHTFTSSGTYTA